VSLGTWPFCTRQSMNCGHELFVELTPLKKRR